MNRIILLLFPILVFDLYAQDPEIGINSYGISPNYVNRRIAVNNNVDGSYYLNDQHEMAVVKLTGSEKEYRYPSRINLNSRVLETKGSQSDYFIPWFDIDYIRFESNNDLFLFDEKLQDLAKVHIQENGLMLLEFFKLDLKEGQYNTSLDVDMNPEWVTSSSVFIKVDNKLVQIDKKKDWKQFLATYPRYKMQRAKLKSPKIENLREYFQVYFDSSVTK